MKSKKQIVLIPFWVHEAMTRNQLPLAECLNLPVLRPVLALQDLVGFCTLQNFLRQLTGVEVSDGLFEHLLDSIPADQPDLKDFFLNQVWAMQGDESFRRDIQARLFEPELKQSCYEEPFITYDLTPTVVGVVIFPGFFTKNGTQELQSNLISAILKVLYVYDTYSEVAKTSLFKRYLELLSPL